MRTPDFSTVAFVLASSVLLAPGVVWPGSSSPGIGKTEAEEEWEAAFETLDVLWGGTREERLSFLDESLPGFEIMADSVPDGSPQVYAIVQSLRSLFASDRDEWFLDRLALELAEGDDALTPLFLDLLEHPSPNVRWRAVEHFYYAEDPAGIPPLVELWRETLPPWIRIDLIDALEDLDWGPLGTECLGWMESEDLELAVRAVEAVGGSEVPEAVAGLARHAGRGPLPLRVAAIQALGGWTESTQALEALLTASRAKDPSVRAAAIRSLGAFDFDRARRKVHAAALDPYEDSAVRHASVATLARIRGPIAIDTLIRIAREPDSGSTAGISRSAAAALRRLGVAGFEPPPMPVPIAVDPLTGQWMSRINPNVIEEMEIITAGAGVRFGGSYAASGLARIVSGDDGAFSTRCWSGPDFVSDPPPRGRLAAGSAILAISDYFDADGRIWAEFGTCHNLCWVPLERLEDAHRGDPLATPDPRAAARVVELDVEPDTADSELAQELDMRGVLTFFDPADGVVGLRIDARDLDDEAVSELLALFPDDQSALSDGLRALLSNIARSTENDDLALRIREAMVNRERD